MSVYYVIRLKREEMQRRKMHIRVALRHSLIALILALVEVPSLWAHPAKGAPAPPLYSLQLLQAPSGARADRASLKGKVVVLEFWATWCSPCIASIPHLNQLVASLDPAKFQFISIDDEDSKVVQTFLTRKKMSGWVGIDSSGKVFAAYGVNSRPTTVIIDGNGKIVAVTEIASVTAADLTAVGDRRKVAFKEAENIVTRSPSPRDIATGPLFAVSLSKAASDAKLSFVHHPPTGDDSFGVDADTLFTDVYNVFENRYVVTSPLPHGLYNLRVNFVDVPQAVRTLAIQQAVLSGLHLQIQPKTITKRAYILRATDASKKLLSPSASTHAVKRGYWHGIFILMNGSMDDLAYVLATGLETPVINETGINGTYDARFKLADVDAVNVDSLNAVLRPILGLELVPGNQEMPITVLEVNKQEESNLSASTKTAQVKP